MHSFRGPLHVHRVLWEVHGGVHSDTVIWAPSSSVALLIVTTQLGLESQLCDFLVVGLGGRRLCFSEPQCPSPSLVAECPLGCGGKVLGLTHPAPQAQTSGPRHPYPHIDVAVPYLAHVWRLLTFY